MAKVVFLGLGVMGYPMAGHLRTRGGHDVTVYNRTRAKADAWVGAFGGRLRSEYTVLGRGVNIAARLEQRCQQGDILVSELVFQQLAPRPGGAREMGALELKGIPEPVRCYCLPGIEGEQHREAPTV